jgi:hypothetical protein
VRSIAVYGICVASSLLLLGCTHRDPQPDSHSTNNASATSTTPALAKASTFAVRFDAASALKSDASREEVFTKLALDAAFAGEPDVARKSLAAIKSDAAREECAFKCAIYLTKAGMGEDALAVAKSIASDAQREKVLTKIANGDLTF